MTKNIAVIGCGYWGKNLVRNFSEVGALACICDPDPIQADKISSEYGTKCLPFEDILENKSIQGIVLAVPAPLHASLAIKALNKGKHVFVEKPLALCGEEAKNMIKASEENNVHLMVGHLLHYHPAFEKLKELCLSGKLGELKYIHSNRKSFGKVRNHEDVIWSFAPHDISMVLSLSKKEPIKIQADSTTILQEDIADIGSIHLAFDSGLEARICVSWLHPYKEHKLIVIGDSGMLVFDDTQPWQQKLLYLNYNSELNGASPSIDKSEMEYLQIEEKEPLKNECLHFLDVVNGKSLPITDGYEGLKVLKVLLEATSS